MSEATERAVLESVPDGLLIDGKWRPAASGRTLDVQDPATGAGIKTIAEGGVARGVGADAGRAGPGHGGGDQAHRRGGSGGRRRGARRGRGRRSRLGADAAAAAG